MEHILNYEVRHKRKGNTEKSCDFEAERYRTTRHKQESDLISYGFPLGGA
jgi:hypothetical protein